MFAKYSAAIMGRSKRLGGKGGIVGERRRERYMVGEGEVV